MKKNSIILISLFLFFHSLLGFAHIQNAGEKVIRVEGKTYISRQGELYEIDDKVVLAKLKSGRELPKIEMQNINNIAFDYYSISVPDSIDVEKYVLMLDNTGCFEYVEYNCVYSPCMTANDNYFNNQWHLSRINATAAWEITTGSPSVKVAVIDNGVELNHPDLYYGNDNYSNLNVGESVDYISSTDHVPSSSHGTMVAGVIGAKTNNSVGVAGVAGGYGCSGVNIISYRTNYTSSQVSYAIYNAISKGVKVINISLGGDFNQSLSDALDYAYNNAVTVVCASGNGNSSSLLFPASHQYTIAVGGTNYNDEVSDSHYGLGLDLVAPGSGIWSTCKSTESYYDSAPGTSMAAPQVAGVVALMLSVNPNLSPSQIRNILHSTCTKLSGYSYNNTGWNEKVGFGLLNAFAAVVVSMNLKIEGPQLIHTYGQYKIENLPSDVTVSWSLSNSNYNNYSHLISNFPALGWCLIFRDDNYDMKNDTLKAEIKYNNVTVQTLKKIVNAYDDFWGQYTSGNLSGEINYSHYFAIKTNTVTTVTSPNLYGATVTYDSSGATPTSWTFYPTSGTLYFTAPAGYIPVIINVHDGCGNDYVLYAYPAAFLYNINISYGDNGFTVTLEGSDPERESNEDQPWTVEVRSATTGQLMTVQSSTSRSESISTAGWPKGIYIVKVTIGKEVLTEKVVVK